MLEDRSFKVKLYLYDEPNVDDIVFFQQDTNTCSLVFEFYEKGSKKYDLTDKKVSVTVVKNGNEVIDIIEPVNGIYKYELRDSAINQPGTYKVIVQAYGIEYDRVSFLPFKYKILSTVNSKNIVNQEEYPVLTKLITECHIEEANRKKDYEDLRKIIIDENNAANIQGQINTIATEYAIFDIDLLGSTINDNKSIKLLEPNYTLTKPVLISNNDVYINGNGSTVYVDGEFNPFEFLNEEILINTIVLNSSITKNDISIRLSDIPSDVSVGDFIKIKSDALWYYDNRGYLTKGEIHLVKNIVGDMVYLDRPFDDDYLTGETLTVSFYKKKNLIIENLNIVFLKQSYNTCIKIKGFYKPTIVNCSIVNSQYLGIQFVDCYSQFTENNTFELSAEDTEIIDTCYGIQEYGSYFGYHTGNKFHNCRRGVDFSGFFPSRYGVVSNCTYTNTILNPTLSTGQSGFGTHGTAENIKFIGNIVNGAQMAFVNRGNNITVEDNTTYNVSDSIVYCMGCGDTIIKNNTHLVNSNSRSDNTSKVNHFVNAVNLKNNSLLLACNNSGVGELGFVRLSVEGNYSLRLNVSNNYWDAKGSESRILTCMKPVRFYDSSIIDNIFTGTNKLYSSINIDFDFSTCNFDDIYISDRDIVIKHFGDGIFTVSQVGLFISKRNSIFKIVGQVKFKVEGKESDFAQVKITGFPQTGLDNHVAPFVTSTFLSGISTKIRNNADLMLSSNNLVTSKGFPLGTHTVFINHTYPMILQ